jgi:hypothetical protein
MNNHLGVRLRRKPMTLALQCLAQFQVVEDLAIEDHCHLTVFIEDGLIAACQVDDAQSRVRQPQYRPLEKTHAVRPPVAQGLGHGFQLGQARGEGRVCSASPIQHPCDAAHPDCPFFIKPLRRMIRRSR